MTMDGNRPILLAAGGTGGHVFPAEALASELLERGYSLMLVTDRRGENWGGALASLPVFAVSAGGVAGRSALRRAGALLSLGRGLIQSAGLIRRIRPLAAVGFGGYASIPAVLAAEYMGVPAIIHEQNAVLGRANRLLAKKATKIAAVHSNLRFVSHPERVAVTGNPVRPAVRAVADAPYPALSEDGPFRILVIGGSQGATIFSQVVPAALALLPEGLKSRIVVSQQCRPADIDEARAFYEQSGVAAELSTFFADAPERMAAAHLTIARAGASTLAELSAIGRPSILVPYPHATDDHQTANARFIDEAGAGWLTPQPDFSPETLARRLEALFSSPETLAHAARCAKAVAVPDAAARLADLAISVALTTGETAP